MTITRGLLQPIEPFGPPAESQFQPLISTSKLDCVPNTVRKLIRRATCDAKSPSTKAIRGATGVTSRGLTYQEGAEAAWFVARVKLVPSFGNERQELFELADGGHAFGLSGNCSVTVHTTRNTGSFTGDHTVYVHDVRHVSQGGDCRCEKKSSAKAHNEYLIEDPGNSSVGYLWWSASLVYAFGEERTRDANGRTHGINLLVGPDTEGALVKALTATVIRSEPRIDATGMGSLDPNKPPYKGRTTRRGGEWKRANGTVANGWREIELVGPNGWVPGKAVVLA